MTHDELIISKIEDKIEQCRDGYYVTFTGLLDSHEQFLARSASRNASGVRTLMYGGYEGAERRMLVCVPSDIPMSDEEATEDLLCVVRVTKPAISKQLTHRDYLGAMLGLGIDRSVTGDILVRDDGADIIVVPEIADFLLREYEQVGRTVIRTERFHISELIIPEARTQIIHDTVPSVRLDNIVSSAFKISRSKAAEAIRGGIVSVDHIECLKPDARVEEGSILVLRGKGKAVLKELGGESKKGRIWISIEKYI
ncbi:MAG: RNA-binding protein [Mogibacterium sp.]|nr:RNA-binding protein [Mogibacterium sp.]